jgi:biotin transporter BioY
MVMVKLMGKAFRGVLEFWLWFSLILWIALGGIGGYVFSSTIGSYYNSSKNILTGAIIGFILGFLVNALFFGLVAKFLILCDNIQKTADNNKI